MLGRVTVVVIVVALVAVLAYACASGLPGDVVDRLDVPRRD